MSKMIGDAFVLASQAHCGQFDKAGRPYIWHVGRVAAAVEGDVDAVTVAWLHDVMEDSADYAQQITHRFPPHITMACHLLDRNKSETERDYYEGIKESPLALKVKLADISDNADEARLAMLEPKAAERLRAKYARALEMLGGPIIVENGRKDDRT